MIFLSPRGMRRAATAALFASLVFALGGAASPPPQPGDGEVLRATLANGLRVIIVRNTLEPPICPLPDSRTSVPRVSFTSSNPKGIPPSR
jgi:hypothetical protein